MAQVVLRYWAAARAATGVESDVVDVTGPVALSVLRVRALDLHPDVDGLADLLGACSVLVDDEPVASRDPAAVLVAPGSTVEFLPPFAGG